MTLDIVLTILAALCIVGGFVGCVVPALPGVALSYVGMLLMHFTSIHSFEVSTLIAWGVVAVAVQVLDYYIPFWGTKKFGGTKLGAWGSTIGVVVGLFFPPWGIIVGPFAGAVVGELIGGKDINQSLKAGWGAFLGFLGGTLMKLVIALIILVLVVIEIVQLFA